MRVLLGIMISSIALVAGCADEILPEAVVEDSVSPPTMIFPAMRWDHRPEASDWTAATLAALRNDGAALLSSVPADIEEWCPAYGAADAEQRAHFWSGLLSALAKHESTWNPAAAGGGGAWIGLMQISPGTAQGFGCAADTAAELMDGAANLQCAVRIASRVVTRDGYVGSNRQGLAADWAPFSNGAKRADMVAWTRDQAYCQR